MSTKPKTEIAWPSGRSVDEYAGFKQWTYKRWAWEFLRRNRDFRQACDRAGEDPALQKQVAADYGLKKFVSYRTCKKRADWAPKFLSSSVSAWSWLNDRTEVRRLRLCEGDVILRFRLSPTVEDEASMAAQLADAERVLKDRQEAYARELGLTAKAKEKGGAGLHFLRNLRLVDLLDGKNRTDSSPGRALRLLHEKPDAKSPMTDAEALDKHRKKIGQARAMVSTGYRILANRDGIPKPKAFETEDVTRPAYGRL